MLISILESCMVILLGCLLLWLGYEFSDIVHGYYKKKQFVQETVEYLNKYLDFFSTNLEILEKQDGEIFTDVVKRLKLLVEQLEELKAKMMKYGIPVSKQYDMYDFLKSYELAKLYDYLEMVSNINIWWTKESKIEDIIKLFEKTEEANQALEAKIIEYYGKKRKNTIIVEEENNVEDDAKQSKLEVLQALKKIILPEDDIKDAIVSEKLTETINLAEKLLVINNDDTRKIFKHYLPNLLETLKTFQNATCEMEFETDQQEELIERIRLNLIGSICLVNQAMVNILNDETEKDLFQLNVDTKALKMQLENSGMANQLKLPKS